MTRSVSNQTRNVARLPSFPDTCKALEKDTSVKTFFKSNILAHFCHRLESKGHLTPEALALEGYFQIYGARSLLSAFMLMNGRKWNEDLICLASPKGAPHG